MSLSDYDAIVVGGGPAGLACAAYLARAGKKVMLCEQHSRPGGYWTSFTRHGVIFDITPHWTIAPATVNQLLADHGVAPLTFEQHKHVGRYLGPGGADIWISADRQRSEDSVLWSFPAADRRNLSRMLDICGSVFDEIESAPAHNMELLSPAARLAAMLPLLYRLRHVLHYARTPGEKFLASFFPGPDLALLRTLLYLTAPIPGISAIGAIAVIGIGLRGRAHSPVGGAQVIGDAFALAARQSGAELRFGQRVDEILLERVRTAGVRLADGQTVTARAVVAAMDARQTYNHLLARTRIPPDFRRKLDAYPPSDPYVIVSLVTDLDPEACGFDGTDTFVTGSADLATTLNPDDPEHGCYSLVFPRYRGHGANPSHHGIQIVSPATFGYNERWRTGPALERDEAYQELKRSYAERLIRRVSAERMPGLSDHIVALDVSTPITMYRYTLNDQGAPIGWGYNNPLRWTQRVPFVPGLYQAGHWVGPSGVVNAAMSGRRAAELILHDRPG